MSGSGFLESVYNKALLLALRQAGLRAQGEVQVEVAFRGENIGIFYADIVEDKVLLEINAVRALAPEHQAQVINHLKATGHEVRLLLNFGRPKLEYKRLRG